MGYSWQFALTAILIEGIIFIILSVTKIREMIVNAIPVQMKAAISVGIGLFIASLGLKNAGIIADSPATLITLGDITSGSALLALIGVVITSILLIYRVKGALLIGILATTLIGIPMGQTSINGIIGMPPDVSPLCLQFEWHNIFTLDMLLVVFTFLFVGIGCERRRTHGSHGLLHRRLLPHRPLLCTALLGNSVGSHCPHAHHRGSDDVQEREQHRLQPI